VPTRSAGSDRRGVAFAIRGVFAAATWIQTAFALAADPVVFRCDGLPYSLREMLAAKGVRLR
jgi:hypothetical protein